MLSEEGMHFHTDTSWTRQVEAVDLALLTRFNRIEHPVLHRLMIGFTKLGDTSSWVILGVTLLVMGGSASLFGQRLAVSALSAAAIAQVLKRIAKRTRPSPPILQCASGVSCLHVRPFPPGTHSRRSPWRWRWAVWTAGRVRWAFSLRWVWVALACTSERITRAMSRSVRFWVRSRARPCCSSADQSSCEPRRGTDSSGLVYMWKCLPVGHRFVIFAI